MGTRSTWTINKKSGEYWVSDGTLYRPNKDFIIPIISTQRKRKKATRADAFITPSTKYIKTTLQSFSWIFDDGTTKTKIENYIRNHDSLKITDHNANIFYGRFISITPIRVVGRDEDEYEIEALFERMPAIA